MMTTVRLALTGPSGAGKSTATAVLRDQLAHAGLSAVVVKIAEPLYEVQRLIYSLCGRPVIDPYRQDGILLGDLGKNFRRINGRSMLDIFDARVSQAESEGIHVVVCDDMRAPDQAHLARNGFRMVAVSTPRDVRVERLRARGDLSGADELDEERLAPTLASDFTIDNAGTRDALVTHVTSLLAVLVPSAHVDESGRP